MFSKSKAQSARTSTNDGSAAKKSAAVPSIVSPELTITGNLSTSGDIQVDGTVDGDVEADNLTIGEYGTINGTVRASALRVLGRINGEIHGDNVTLLSSAKVNGDVAHESLAIEAGAMIEGHCRRRAQNTTTDRKASDRRGAVAGKAAGSQEKATGASKANGETDGQGLGTASTVSARR